MALADEFDGFLVDLDGVVWIGRELISGAVETLEKLLADRKEIVFVTNNPGKPATAYAERLRQSGVPIDEDRIVTAGESTADLAAKGAETAFVLGAAAFHDTVAASGLKLLEGEGAHKADAVIVSGHRGFDYAELLTATRALQAGAALFATSRDPTMPFPGGPVPGTGAVLAAVETASGVTAQICGKPESHLFELARERVAGAERVAMIGDRVSSDIEGGRRAGLATVLVLTGADTRADAEASKSPPDHVIDDLPALLR